MRIVDGQTMKSLHSVIVLLTPDEARELASKVKSLDGDVDGHIHVNDIDLKWEVTVSIYTMDNVSRFRDEIQKILLEG